MNEIYTPGYTANAIDFMARRTARTHAAFLLPLLKPGMRLLDCGCGPGTITAGLAQAVAPGEVVGIDREPSQLAIAERNFKAAGLGAEFRVASVYDIPCADASFDVVFAHAIFEHLKEPTKAVAEFHRVLKHGGLVALRSPDWGGFIFGPNSTPLDAAVEFYKRLQVANGGDVLVGRKLKGLLIEAGFVSAQARGACESYEPIDTITEFMALRIEDSIEKDQVIDRRWATEHEIREMCLALRALPKVPGAMFVGTWCEAIARKP